jgi:hypothetical protein
MENCKVNGALSITDQTYCNLSLESISQKYVFAKIIPTKSTL